MDTSNLTQKESDIWNYLIAYGKVQSGPEIQSALNKMAIKVWTNFPLTGGWGAGTLWLFNDNHVADLVLPGEIIYRAQHWNTVAYRQEFMDKLNGHGQYFMPPNIDRTTKFGGNVKIKKEVERCRNSYCGREKDVGEACWWCGVK